jgi:predicted metalloprotease with PDZ domain
MRGWDKDTDNVMMLENGYDFMGFSGFVSTNLPPSIALEHGQNIKADLILIYDRQINEGDRASQFKQARRKAIEEKRVKDFGKVTEIEITEEDLVDPNVMYDFYASYWVKLPKPTFGTHFIELGKGEDSQSVEGVQVIAVIKGSAAANAGIVRNDSITSINGQKVTTPEQLISLIRENKGSDINVGYIRNGKPSETVASI